MNTRAKGILLATGAYAVTMGGGHLHCGVGYLHHYDAVI